MSTTADIIEQNAAERSGLPTPMLQANIEERPASHEAIIASMGPGLYLRALRSYFRISSHPLSDSERAQVSSRNFINETRIARHYLLRCTELLMSLSPDVRPALLDEDVHPGVSAETRAARNSYVSIEEVSESVKDLLALCDALIENGKVSFQAWVSLGKIVSRELELTGAEWVIEQACVPHPYPVSVPNLVALTGRIAPDPLATDVGAIFSALFQMLKLLGHIEVELLSDEPLKQTLPLFTLVREESLALLGLISERTLRIEGLEPALHEQLDGIAYAIRMELRKAFEHELVGLAGMRHPRQIYAKVENAHGLLRDCFQQSVISVAQAFEPQFDGAKLFNRFRTKLEQSLLLRRELWEVLEVVRRASEKRDQRALQALLERLASFREGSLRFLMYKDWESLERFAEELTAAKYSADIQPVLHRFHAFLETLFGQINMRAVLADHPFVPPTSKD